MGVNKPLMYTIQGAILTVSPLFLYLQQVRGAQEHKNHLYLSLSGDLICEVITDPISGERMEYMI